MRRFFVPPQLLDERRGVLGSDLGRHLVTVLRLGPGDSVLLADGSGREAVAHIAAVSKEGVSLDIEPPRPAAAAEAPLAITLLQGLPKGDKLDLVLQKATELGVARIVPFLAERSVSRVAGEKRDRRLQRWERIAMEAARQSGRRTIPVIGYAENLADALRRETGDLRLLLWEEEQELGLRAVLGQSEKPASVAVIIGPEGGLTPAEAATATAAGFVPLTLGSRILRTETAGLAIVAILQYLWGDLGKATAENGP